MDWTAALSGDLEDWCAARLGAPPIDQFFEARSMSWVRGVELADGRRVAVKVRAASDQVLACAEAQRLASAAGIDCPELLAGPEPLPAPTTRALDEGETLWVSAEDWRADGSPTPPGDAAEAYVTLHVRLLDALAGLPPERFAPPPPWAHYDHDSPGRSWPPAASPRWDPESPAVPDDLRFIADAARRRLLAEPLPAVVGHADLNG